MTRIKINLIRISLLLLIVLLSINIFFNCITFYQNNYDSENTILSMSVFILGITIGLVVRCGLSLAFWHLYNIKYPNEKYNARILKKVIASLLFLTIISAVSFGAEMYLVFIICSLALMIRGYKRNETTYELNDE